MGLQLPTFEEILAGRTPTLRHVPARVRHLWARVLTRALAAVTHHNDEASWRELLMLPQCVLDPPRRGGRKHARATAAYTLDRLRQWEDGERLLLWQTRQQPQRGRRRPLNKAEREELAKGLAREGFESKACTALLPTGPSRRTPKPLRLFGPFILRLLNLPCRRCMSCLQRPSLSLMWLLRHFAVSLLLPHRGLQVCVSNTFGRPALRALPVAYLSSWLLC